MGDLTMSHDLNGNPAGERLAAENIRLRRGGRPPSRGTARTEAIGGRGQTAGEEKAEITTERDDYLKSLYYLTQKDWTFTEEEIADAGQKRRADRRKVHSRNWNATCGREVRLMPKPPGDSLYEVVYS